MTTTLLAPVPTRILDPSDSFLETINEARDYLNDRAHDGVECPACEQFVKVYRRKITSTTARSLILMYREKGERFQHVPTTIGRQSADEVKSGAWGLIESQGGSRADGSKKTGWWRVTAKGAAWIRGEITIPKYVVTYNGRILGFEGEEVTIKDALGTKFDYRELMAGI